MKVETDSHGKLVDTIDRLQTISALDELAWLDLLEMSWAQYSRVRSGLRPLPQPALERIADVFHLAPAALSTGEIDFLGLQREFDAKTWEMPEHYAVAMRGRRRTTITSFEYLEEKYGWRLRHDILRHLKMSELALDNEFSPISIRFISDVCEYLYRHREFTEEDFFAMGFYSYFGNSHSLLADVFREFETPRGVTEHMWGQLIALYEENCIYKFDELNEESARLEVRSNPDVAAAMGVKHLGNRHICQLKAGMMASAPLYIGHRPAQVIQSACVHQGDSACLFEIDFSGTILN